MAAGLGFKTFNTGDVLTSGDVNGYLMQGVWVFANSAARSSAVTSPQEGNVSFLKDTNAFEIYDGAAWVAYGSGDITGVTAGTGLSGGGTSGDVTLTNTMATAIDAKGDLVVGTGADTFSRLAVGTNNQALLADSTTATGLKWGSVSANKSFSLISTTALSGNSTVTISSGLSGYDTLVVLVDYATSSAASNAFHLRINGSTTASDYAVYGISVQAGSGYSAANALRTFGQSGQTRFPLGSVPTTTSSCSSGIIIQGCTGTGSKMVSYVSTPDAGGSNNNIGYWGNGIFKGTGTVSSVSLIAEISTFSGGNLIIWGSNN